MSNHPYKPGPFLSQITVPSDLRANFTEEQLPQVAQELRQYIVDVISEIGNSHFGASLGVVELTVALHYAFNTPEDQLVWDVGHQAYGHKILTGRREKFHTNRLKGGISGFPKRSESEYDTFGVGHSSTSISAALGMAVANHYKGETKRQHIAVIGDGAMTAGLAFEGLNHAGFEKDANLLVILNDNCMSIDPNVGALKEYLTDITTSHTYNKVKDEVWKLLGKVSKFGPDAQTIASKVSHALKGTLLKQSNLFEAFNFRYFGPVDGHDVIGLAKVMADLKDIPGPKILHCVTRKGAGYKFSEEGNPTKWHAPGVFNKETGEIVKIVPKSPEPPKYQDVFGHSIVELAEKNDKIMGVTPAMPSGCSLNIMMQAMPKRAFDVGIAEQHAVTFSAGLATQGMVPFCNIYSSFMQRAFDQVLHDVAIQNLNVVFCLDRGGLVGADGATHHGAYDLAYMRMIPNMVVAAPMNEEELRNLMYTAQLPNQGPFSIRYPRGNGVMTEWKTPFKEIKVGEGRKVTAGEDIAILTIGHPGNFAQKAIESLQGAGVSIAHYDMRFVKPLDNLLLHEVFSKFKKVITVEDGCLMGGFGSAVLEFMVDQKYQAEVVRLGIPDEYIHHGTQEELWADCGFDTQSIIQTISTIFQLNQEKITQQNVG
ncbi:MAG: 1-deoxy-D-xylulose-5-phosphate synthase [Crocinitomicaceae bacterium]|nr:1-deoxy-D-xylulose-5-phosphate synthase [Crocinitomicaceae bacterium]MDP4723392.1 1-deoxy-D-xylulose-5-phosphate synthase [Crocinitomicaceae bacterium]MDP4739373.1 1-deoxy-D-xylulose-5-phosphate synthase [Crocinitomicaceae bacterium]MDP4805891.1 1-deoxy-D-xylulose-5-phosphate synthase [Crocinitomicaceae bacterium]MDP4867847.1 1-deoxy-D-xylulose-5-phosphate synthase [Crocinitomicaceae bacterium]